MREYRELKINPSNSRLPWISRLLLIYSICHIMSNFFCLLYSLALTIKNIEAVLIPIVGAGAPSVEEVVVHLGLQRALIFCPALTDRFSSMLACRSCWTVLMRWRLSVTWARQTSHQGFGLVWNSEAQRARMMALWVAAVTSPAALDTACLFVPVVSPTEASMGHTWWLKTAEDCWST